MPYHWQSYLEWTILGLVCTLSIIKGAKPERWGAAIILAANLSSDVAFALTLPHVPQFTLFYLDLLLSIGLLSVAFTYSSLWIGTALLLQSVILLTHALALEDDGISSLIFVATNNFVSNLMYACLLGATLMSWRARSHGRGLKSGKEPQGATPLHGAGTLAL